MGPNSCSGRQHAGQVRQPAQQEVSHLSIWREALVVQVSAQPCQRGVAGSCTDPMCAASGVHVAPERCGMAAHAVQQKAASDLLHPEGILEYKPNQSIVRSRWNACIAREAFRGERAGAWVLKLQGRQ